MNLTPEQDIAFRSLLSDQNIFLTGGAGTGKSFLVRKFLFHVDRKQFPVLASTGAAAILIGGRTFHSFFGLGIMEGGARATYDRVIKDNKVLRRLRKVDGFVVDEVSMIPGPALAVAEALCRHARENDQPWGGLRVVAVGDFAQLPPVEKNYRQTNWAFLEPVWQRTGFYTVYLQDNLRCQDPFYSNLLSQVRLGEVSDDLRDLLNSSMTQLEEVPVDVMRLFPHRKTTQQFNLQRLESLDTPLYESPSDYSGNQKVVERLKKASPLPEVLQLKQGARVMLLTNDPRQRWFNGTLATVVDFEEQLVHLETDKGKEIELEKTVFSMLDAEGNVIAAVSNFPLALAYASTIHKAQGVTLDSVCVDLRRLWEPGQAYVALSRLRKTSGLHLIGWEERSFIIADEVAQYYRDLSVGLPKNFETEEARFSEI